MAQVGDHITHIRVCNNNPFRIIDRYDGVQYVFEPEKPLSIPAEVASHIFGYSPSASEEDMLRHIQRRFGWNTPEFLRDETYMMFFDQLDIKPVTYKLVEVPVGSDPDEAEPVEEASEPERKRQTKTGRGPGRPKKALSKPAKRAPDSDDLLDEPAQPESADVAA